MPTNPVRALPALLVAGAPVLTACSSTSEGASSGSPSPPTSPAASAPASPSAAESAKQDKKGKKTSAPAPQSSQPTAQPSQPAERTIDCGLAQDSVGAYFSAFSGFATAMSSGDPGQVFTAARQFSDVLNGFQASLPDMSDNSKVFIGLSKEATRIALTASESGDPAALAAAATEIESLLYGDADRYTSGQEELQEYLDANCAVAPWPD